MVSFGAETLPPPGVMLHHAAGPGRGRAGDRMTTRAEISASGAQPLQESHDRQQETPKLDASAQSDWFLAWQALPRGSRAGKPAQSGFTGLVSPPSRRYPPGAVSQTRPRCSARKCCSRATSSSVPHAGTIDRPGTLQRGVVQHGALPESNSPACRLENWCRLRTGLSSSRIWAQPNSWASNPALPSRSPPACSRGLDALVRDGGRPGCSAAATAAGQDHEVALPESLARTD